MDGCLFADLGSVLQVLNLGHNAVVMYACFTGLGTRDAKLNLPIMVEGAKVTTPIY